MQREVVKILKKHLHDAYYFNDKSTEIMYCSPFTVLASGGPENLPLEPYTLLDPPPEDWMIRALARELIATIRGIKDIDLIVLPDKDRTIRFLMDIYPGNIEEQEFWAEYHAHTLLEWLNRLHQPELWRGQRLGILKAQALMPLKEPETTQPDCTKDIERTI